MSDILSQAEIDELLNALSSGNDPEPPPQEDASTDRAKPYDFKTANRFPKEQMRTIHLVFDSFAQLYSNQLTGVLRTSCECEVLSVEELTFNEFNNSLPIPVILAILEMPPMTGQQLMEVSPEAAYMIISRLLGGTASGSESSKQFTEIELTLIERVLQQMMHLFREAWDKIVAVDARLDRLETSSQFTQIVALNEPIAVVTLNLTIGDESGLISICLPHSSIEPVSKQLNTRLLHSGAQEGSQIIRNPEQIEEKIRRTAVALTAYFNETSATVADIVNLQVGDVIRLSQRTEEPLLMKIQHIPKFHAKIGTSGSQYAVQIVDIIKEGNEDESIPG